MPPAAPSHDLFAPDRWGLPAAAVDDLADRLLFLWTRFRSCFRTTTRDGSDQAWVYLRGLLTMTTERSFANIARRVVDPADAGQALQQFMSDSPWSAAAVTRQVQAALAATPALQTGGVLILDERADEKAGAHRAGASRQDNGRLGKVELSQVGVCLAFATGPLWTWIAGALFLPNDGFGPELAGERARLGIPATRQFASKLQVGWQMVHRVLANGVAVEVLLCDALYGRSGWLRHQLATAHVLSVADVPAATQV
jgi:SRSO17 transposase